MEHAATHQQETMRRLNDVLPSTNLIARAFRLRGPLDRDAVPRAIAQVFRRHAATRTTFHPGFARRHDEPVVGLRETDLRGAPDDVVLARVSEAAETPFDLGELPMLRLWLFRLADEEHLFLWQAHHAIADGLAFVTLLGDFVRCYLAAAAGLPFELPPAPASLAEVAAWESAYLASEAGARQLDALHRRLAGALPVLELEGAPPRAGRPRLHAGVRAVTIGPDTAKALAAQARAARATVSTLVFAVFLAMLRRWSGQDVVLASFSVSQRMLLPDPRSVALAMSLVPTRADLGDDPPFLEALQRARVTAHHLRDDCAIPGTLIAERLGRPLHADPAALCQAHYNFVDARLLEQAGDAAALLGAAGSETRIGPLTMTPVELPHRLVPYDLFLTGGIDAERRLGFQLVHRLDRVSPALATRFVAELGAAFATVAQAPETPVSRLGA